MAVVFRGGITFAQPDGPTDTSVIAPGLAALTIDGKGVTAATTPVSDTSPRPLFVGRVMPGADSVTLSIPEATLSFEVQVDEDTGAFSARAPQDLDPGTYTLEINGTKVAAFTVTEAAAPALTIDGEEVTAPTAVVSDTSPRPLFEGRVDPGADSVTLSIPEASLSFKVKVDKDTGAFSAKAPQDLAPGTYTLEIDGEKVATFTVEAAAAGDDGISWLLLIIIIAAVVAGVAAVIGIVYFQSARRQRS